MQLTFASLERFGDLTKTTMSLNSQALKPLKKRIKVKLMKKNFQLELKLLERKESTGLVTGSHTQAWLNGLSYLSSHLLISPPLAK